MHRQPRRPTRSVATGLERAALRARRRGGVAVEAMALARAARLTPDGERRAARLLAAARSTAHAGRLGPAAVVLEEALALVRPGGRRRRRAGARAPARRGRARASGQHTAAAGSRRRRAARSRTRRAAARRGRAAPARRARARGGIGQRRARRRTRRARAFAEREGRRHRARGDSARSRSRRRCPRDAAARMRARRRHHRFLAGPALAHALAAVGEGECARPMLARLLEQDRVAGDLWSLQEELVALADLELRAGQLDAALEAAREALQLADELGSVRARRRSLLALALVEAPLGHEIDCREHVREGLDGRRARCLRARGGRRPGPRNARPEPRTAGRGHRSARAGRAPRAPSRAARPWLAPLGAGGDRVVPRGRARGRRT